MTTTEAAVMTTEAAMTTTEAVAGAHDARPAYLSSPRPPTHSPHPDR
ncbi:hypothetical protein OG301_30375 [Streptomyces platensis]|nr:hypothetical protein OG301_30375 [Streptomyces platensis]